MFDQLEKLEDIEARRVRAMTLQKEAFVRLNVERIFVDEVLKLESMFGSLHLRHLLRLY